MNPQSSDDDSDVAPEEIEEAVNDTTAPDAAEVDAETKDLTEWDQSPAAAGREIPQVREDDETTIAERLVTDGIEEADRDRRIAASDPDFEP